MNQVILRILIRLAIYIVKTGRIRGALQLALWAIKTKASYDEAMGRLDGSYYEKQVRQAAEDYKAKHPDEYECSTNGVPGFDRWRKAQGP